jgi:hypothetical protein
MERVTSSRSPAFYQRGEGSPAHPASRVSHLQQCNRLVVASVSSRPSRLLFAYFALQAHLTLSFRAPFFWREEPASPIVDHKCRNR